MDILTKEQKQVLSRARATYGYRNQLAVAAEECNELAIAVLKFMRYNDLAEGVVRTRKNVLEERADVEVVLNHIDEIYGITKAELEKEVSGKINRVNRWLEKSDKLSVSMVDRAVNPARCDDCFYYDHFEESIEACKKCKKFEVKNESI